eukprot:NODE_199_length_13192_cov_0.539219.p6 type:complete len:307 gc:universal NODE_199_length_13192_cov_0.539219:5679-4759(-)
MFFTEIFLFVSIFVAFIAAPTEDDVLPTKASIGFKFAEVAKTEIKVFQVYEGITNTTHSGSPLTSYYDSATENKSLFNMGYSNAFLVETFEPLKLKDGESRCHCPCLDKPTAKESELEDDIEEIIEDDVYLYGKFDEDNYHVTRLTFCGFGNGGYNTQLCLKETDFCENIHFWHVQALKAVEAFKIIFECSSDTEKNIQRPDAASLIVSQLLDNAKKITLQDSQYTLLVYKNLSSYYTTIEAIGDFKEILYHPLISHYIYKIRELLVWLDENPLRLLYIQVIILFGGMATEAFVYAIYKLIKQIRN